MENQDWWYVGTSRFNDYIQKKYEIVFILISEFIHATVQRNQQNIGLVHTNDTVFWNFVFLFYKRVLFDFISSAFLRDKLTSRDNETECGSQICYS